MNEKERIINELKLEREQLLLELEQLKEKLGIVDTSDLDKKPITENTNYYFDEYPRYNRTTERVFSYHNQLKSFRYYGYLGGDNEWFKGSEYLFFNNEICGIVRQDTETLEDFDKRFKNENKQYEKTLKDEYENRQKDIK